MNPFIIKYTKNSINRGSLSFSLASKLLDNKIKRNVLMLYAWCRYCDDIIDGQILGNSYTGTVTWWKKVFPTAEHRLAYLQSNTRRAYAGLPMNEPAFIVFQEIALNQDLPLWQALDHLEGFAMDVRGHSYDTFEDTMEYCYHIAGVIGIMISHFLGIKDEQIIDRACDLGLAFQLTNIARDIIDDAKLGRCYLPKCWLNEFGLNINNFWKVSKRTTLANITARLLMEAEQYYISAKVGLRVLPWRYALAIITALNSYRFIGYKIKKYGSTAWNKRQKTNFLEKIVLLIMGAGTILISRGKKLSPRPLTLWQRPHITKCKSTEKP